TKASKHHLEEHHLCRLPATHSSSVSTEFISSASRYLSGIAREGWLLRMAPLAFIPLHEAVCIAREG
ncbi:hypothetical protein, partial [Dictyobacter arantiisoli]|uniref:hypothetical protein n=1 Tax=Dictyobacter arantiisoli TaxID=2014874 RepID=UPI001C0EFDE7